MTEDLKTKLAELEAEFAAMQQPLDAMLAEWQILRDQVRPLEEKMAGLEAKRDTIRHRPRYKELAEQLPHLRKAVGQ